MLALLPWVIAAALRVFTPLTANVGVLVIASLKVAVTVTVSPDAYGPDKLAVPPSVYVSATVGAV